LSTTSDATPRARQTVQRRHAVRRHHRAQAHVGEHRGRDPTAPGSDAPARRAFARRLPDGAHAAVGAIHALSAFGRRCRRQLLLLLLLPAGAGAILATAVPRAPAAVEAEWQRARRRRAAPVRVHAPHRHARHGSHFYAPTRPMARRPRGERKHALDTVARRRCRAQVASKTQPGQQQQQQQQQQLYTRACGARAAGQATAEGTSPRSALRASLGRLLRAPRSALRAWLGRLKRSQAVGSGGVRKPVAHAQPSKY
jgi:hypothetical protein